MVLKGKKAFLTGGGGYVGSQLARHLEEHGYEVVVADVKFVDSISAAECDPKGLRVQVALVCLPASRAFSIYIEAMHAQPAYVVPDMPLSVALPARSSLHCCSAVGVALAKF